MRLLLALIALASFAAADEVKPPKIILPIHPVIVEPDEPKPIVDPSDPKIISEIKPDEMYVIESDAKLYVMSSPAGVLDISTANGPIRVRGKFSDGSGALETRTYKSQWVYFVTTSPSAKTSQKSEIFMVPDGVKDESEISRQVLTVVGANPPPEPEPEPTPDPEPTPKTAHVRLAIVEDTLNRSPDTAILLNALVGWNAFHDSGHQWRQYDKATQEANGIKAKSDASSITLPAMIIYDLETGKVLKAAPLSKTFDELKAVIGELTHV